MSLLRGRLQHEGLVLGGSSAINIVGAMRLARDLGPGKTIVTIVAVASATFEALQSRPSTQEKLASTGLDEVSQLSPPRPASNPPRASVSKIAVCGPRHPLSQMGHPRHVRRARRRSDLAQFPTCRCASATDALCQYATSLTCSAIVVENSERLARNSTKAA